MTERDHIRVIDDGILSIKDGRIAAAKKLPPLHPEDIAQALKQAGTTEQTIEVHFAALPDHLTDH